jgi:hypothetical protein
VSRAGFPLVYQGHRCPRHRSSDRLVETDECLACVGPERIQAMQQERAHQETLRQTRRLLYELSDGGKTTLELLEVTRGRSSELHTLLETLRAGGIVAYGEERTGRQSRWLWWKTPIPRAATLPLSA